MTKKIKIAFVNTEERTINIIKVEDTYESFKNQIGSGFDAIRFEHDRFLDILDTKEYSDSYFTSDIAHSLYKNQDSLGINIYIPNNGLINKSPSFSLGAEEIIFHGNAIITIADEKWGNLDISLSKKELEEIIEFYGYNKNTSEKEEINTKVITFTQIIQDLIEASEGAIDSKEKGIKMGYIPRNLEDKDIIGFLLARITLAKYDTEISPKFISSFLSKYCTKEIATSFVYFYKIYLKLDKEIEKSYEEIMFPYIDIYIDIFETAKNGKSVGWKKHWNPFDEKHTKEWEKGFKNDY